ncbi:MAG: EAL domain-containing protein [Epsilonproteobacteria bacterium]|nr:MAG: EAL domain-containing protein [Campylobacterota bacterium]
MLLSAKEERERRFKLALRGGIPILMLVFLLFYTTFSKGSFVALTIENAFLMSGLIFTTIYFIYFLLELDVKETLLDNITEGFNQETFLKKIEKHQPETVAILLVNNFSTISENYGISATNSLLHTIVSRLNYHIYAYQAKQSWIGRYSGAEFLIALDLESNKVQKMIKNFIQENQTIDTIEIDYRFAVINHGKAEPEKILALLKDELASQEIKPSKKPTAVKDATLLSKLERSVIYALEKESLNFYFRPLYNIKKGMIDSYEIAIKLKIQGGSEILPRDYLPIVNRHGLGRTYDLAIFKKITDMTLLINEEISFSFNLSPFSLRDRDFLENIFTIIEDKEINAQRLIIEIYERKTHHNLSKYLKVLSKVRAKGMRICIDNFGSSNASMEYMKHFKFDVVQFDRDFVSNFDDDNSLSIFKSLIDMSKGLQITTIAKWVDNEKQKQRLEDLGVDYLQGFGIGKQFTERQLIQHYNP